MLNPYYRRVWMAIVGWDNFWLDFGGAPFTAHTFPG